MSLLLSLVTVGLVCALHVGSVVAQSQNTENTLQLE